MRQIFHAYNFETRRSTNLCFGKLTKPITDFKLPEYQLSSSLCCQDICYSIWGSNFCVKFCEFSNPNSKKPFAPIKLFLLPLEKADFFLLVSSYFTFETHHLRPEKLLWKLHVMTYIIIYVIFKVILLALNDESQKWNKMKLKEKSLLFPMVAKITWLEQKFFCYLGLKIHKIWRIKFEPHVE